MSPRPTRACPSPLALLLILALLLCLAGGPTVRASLEGAVASRSVPLDLVITYTAMHPLHGGAIVEIFGDGAVVRTTRRRGDLQASIRQTELGTDDLLGLVDLLVELEAWEQRVPERPPVPDEGRASIHIEIAGREAGFWEWYNDLGEHDRLLRISELMTDLALR